MKHPLRTLGILAAFAFVALLFVLSDVPTVYKDTATKEVVGCSRDGIKMSADDEICKVIVKERNEVMWVQPGWEVE